MFSTPSNAPNARQIERRRLILNEKYKGQSGFYYNLGVAIVSAGPISGLIRQTPVFDLPLIVLSCTFGCIFYVIGNNRLDQMVE